MYPIVGKPRLITTRYYRVVISRGLSVMNTGISLMCACLLYCRFSWKYSLTAGNIEHHGKTV